MSIGDKVVKLNFRKYLEIIEDNGELFVSINSLVEDLSRARVIMGEENPAIYLNNLIEYLKGIHVV